MSAYQDDDVRFAGMITTVRSMMAVSVNRSVKAASVGRTAASPALRTSETRSSTCRKRSDPVKWRRVYEAGLLLYSSVIELK